MIRILLFIFLSALVFSQSKPVFSDGLLDISGYISGLDTDSGQDLDKSLSYIDSVYIYALKLFRNDCSEALFCISFACLPYKKLSITTPVTQLGLSIHFPAPDEILFRKRFDKLPEKIFIDSPASVFGDKDKLSHFFGNAFLSYNISFFNISKFMGMFVELFENTFKVDGKIDLRDLRANNFGALFGETLNKNQDILPSQILRMYSLFYFSPIINYR